MGESLLTFGQRVESARRKFFREGLRPDGLVPELVICSWERSLADGIDTRDCRIFNPITRQDQALIRERTEPLIASARPELERLHLELGRGGWIVACADADGIVVSSICGEDIRFRQLADIFQTGRNVSESTVGTNGPGCALTLERPVVVQAGEHFLEEVHPFVCAAVPIFGPSGAAAGVLDATRVGPGGIVTVLDPLALAARAIEIRLLADLRGALTVGLHHRSELLGTPLEAAAVFDDEGNMLGANRAAREILGLPLTGSANANFDALLCCPRQVFARALAGRLERGVVHNRDGLRLEARFQGPLSSSMTAGVMAHVRRLHAMTSPSGAEFPASDGPTDIDLDPAIGQASHVARRAFERDIPVLINGETGTGKEVFARRLHRESTRRDGPFVAINCASIPAGLIESEFFGYEDGAFTGGRRGGMAGKFEKAKGGTLFLDEIGDMPIDLQGRLLRVLQERSFTRLGGTRPISFEARVIAATHRRLEALLASGEFRADLYYRINGVRIHLPCLRERKDRAHLIRALLAREAHPESAPVLSPEVEKFLLEYPWPGNIRQLEHALRLALTLSDGGRSIELCHLPEDLLADAARLGHEASPTRQQAGKLRDIELEAVRLELQRNGGNVSATARSLGVARATLYRKLRLLGLA